MNEKTDTLFLKTSGVRIIGPVSGLFLWLTLLILSTCVSAFAAQRLTIVAGGDHKNPPYEYLKDGKPTGFNVELMRAVAQAIGADVEFRLGPWAKVREALEQGKIDALTGMYYSEERSRLVDFSVPHTMVSPGLFIRKDSPIRSIDDIKDKSVIVQRGDIVDDYLRENKITSHITTVTDPADELRLLASGRHDCALMPSRLQGEYLIHSLGLSNIRVIGTDLPQLRYCFAVAKGDNALRFRLDEGLNILKVNGKYGEIYDKWFGMDEKRDLWRSLRYLVWGMALIVLLLAATFIWSWSLRRQVRIRTEELRDRERRMRFTQYAVDNTIDQAFWMTEDGRFFYVNDAACRALGYSREELTRMSIPDIDPTHPPEVFAEHWRELREMGSITMESRHRAKDGRVYPVEIRANYVVFDGNAYNCAFATDITGRKQMEAALERSRDELERRVDIRTVELAETVEAMQREIVEREKAEAALHQLNSTLEERVWQEVAKNREKDVILIQQNRQAALGEILDHIAHQWKQPLAGISLMAYLLKANPSATSTEVNETADTIIEQTKNLTNILSDFRDFYRHDKEKSIFLIKDSVDRALSFVRPALRFGSIAAEVDVDPDLRAFGYPKQFTQVILNIVSNARDAFKDRKVEKPLLRINGFVEESMAVVTITDNAGGIDEEAMTHIFEMNFTTKEQSGGTGIGLYMSKNLIEREMGGTLVATNVPEGAQFCIRLALADS